VQSEPSAQSDMTPSSSTPRLTALIVDWGGVLTAPLDGAMTSWAEQDGVDFTHFTDVMRHWVGAQGPGPVASGGAGEEPGPEGEEPGPEGEEPGPEREEPSVERDEPRREGNEPRPEGERPSSDVLAELEAAARHGLVPASPVHALERGEMTVEEFERQLAQALAERGSPVSPEGLLGRLLGGLAELHDDMLGLVRRARRHGIHTALLSNSWGDHYPEHAWEGAFDAVIISGRVGMRKPDTEIYRHTANALGVPPQQCVMVDDLAHNVRGAVEAGMVGVLHRSYEETVMELEALFDRPLR